MKRLYEHGVLYTYLSYCLEIGRFCVCVRFCVQISTVIRLTLCIVSSHKGQRYRVLEGQTLCFVLLFKRTPHTSSHHNQMADTAPSNNDGNCLPPPPPTHYRDDKNNGRYEDEGYFNAANDDTSEASFQPLAVSSASEDEMDVEGDLSLNELMYSAHSFHVISLPVTITMVLAAMAVTYINTPETIAQGEQLMSQAYHVWKVDAETDSTSKQLAVDFANSLVIVSAIGAMTFGIVLLYKYRCMKVLIGYMMFSSMTLLGVLGAELFNVAIDKYRIPIGKKVSSLLACLYFI